MNRPKRTAISIALALCGIFLTAAPAQAAFGLSDADVTFTDSDSTTAMQAGSHPFAWTTTMNFNVAGEKPDGGAVKDLLFELPPGFAVNPTAVPRCSAADFVTPDNLGQPSCPAASAVGIIGARGGKEVANPEPTDFGALYNLAPPPGSAARFGFRVLGTLVIVEGGVRSGGEYRLYSVTPNISQREPILGSKLTLWGDPADPGHDSLRGKCLSGNGESAGSCPVLPADAPFLTLPTSCSGPLTSIFQADSWQNPGVFTDPLIAATHDESDPPEPLGTYGCGRLPFHPTITAQPTARAATSPTGLDFSLDVKDEGLMSTDGLAASAIRKAEVTLPEGMSVNPSQAEGLEVCSQAELAKETPSSPPGVGCPEAAKVGTIEVETPLLEESLEGSLYVAKPYENEFNSLLALYIVIKNANRGVLITQAAKVTPNPVTGRLVTTTEDMPQLPFSHFRLHFREGARSPLATPPACGSYAVKARLTPWSGAAPITTTSAFEVISGPNSSPCPSGGLPPFKPGLTAGTTNNAAGRFSPFNVRLTRTDSEQEFTHFSIKLPPGVAAKLAGIPFCSDAAIAAATARTGPHGGQEELDSPSCPAASQVGRTLAGGGVGPSLAYAPGKAYLAGPYHGHPLSIVAITAGVVGPFDIGTVVVRLAIDVNPETGEVFLDSTGSDPIPHIIQGIPIHLRDIRAYTDRPEFTFNPTSCERMSTAATVLGSGLDFVSPADDNPFVSTSPFQAADCASLGFKPKLSLKLRGATRRGGNPALRAVLRPRSGDANSKSISVQLPHSEFLDQSHIRTVCTRVQFKAGAGNGVGCPAGSIYGHARVWTPLLSEPLEGPVFLRSSEHPLPDLVLAVHGLIDFNGVGRIDSVKGGIRNTFDFVPDAPITKVVVDFQGGKKGLLINSTNLCKSENRAKVEFNGHNGKAFNANPVLEVKCKKAKAQKRRARAAR